MTPPMTDDIVGRLRSYADTCTGLEPRRIITDAADHIAGTGKLVARIEALEGDKALFRQVFERLDQGRGPGHCHAIPGIWDDDPSNGDKAGTPCEWCAMWSETRAALAKDKSDG